MIDRNEQRLVVHRSWRFPVPVIVRAEGIYLYDEGGRRYIDGASGSSVVVNIGHGVRRVVDAMHEQGLKVSFAAPHLFSNEPLIRLGAMIADRAPGIMRNNCRTWLGCTGTDAVDSALRLARQYFVTRGLTSKAVTIGRWQGFHGNNISMAGVHGHTFRRRMYFPMYVDSPHVPPAYCYRCHYEMTRDQCRLKCARALEVLIRQTGAENVAAFIAEPVVGAALGAVPAPDGYFQVIREICDKYDVLMIDDEVMTGWGRTGRWFAIEDWGVTPDIIATAKGISSGYTPISATIATDHIWQTLEDSGMPFLAGHTMNQNPVSCAGAIANLEYVEDNDLLSRSREMGVHLLGQLSDLARDSEIVGAVHGKGLMCGFELVKDKATREPFEPGKKASVTFEREAMRRGLSIFSCSGSVDGVAGDMILVTPPLVMTREQIDELVQILGDTVEAVQSTLLN